MKRQKKKLEKGELHYISIKKREQLINTFIFALIGIGIFLIGYILNDFSRKNIFTILAMLMTLPAARALTNAVLFFPYHDADAKEYKQLSDIIPSDAKFYASLVMTSAEKVMNLDFLIIGGGYIFGCLGKEKQDIHYIQSYLKKGVNTLSHCYEVKVVAEKKQFLEMVKKAPVKEIEKQEQQKVREYLNSLIA